MLSFDDGPSPEFTPQVLSILEQKHVTASFFVIGNRVAGNEALLHRMVADGFEIGNHSWSHPQMTKLTKDQILTEIQSTQAAISLTGVPQPTLFRPPYGAINDSVVHEAGLQTALWNIDPEDWRSNDPNLLAQSLIATAKPGGVMDLHDVHPAIVAALPTIIDQLSAQGYQFVTVSQLLHSRDRPGHDPFYGYADPALPAN